MKNLHKKFFTILLSVFFAFVTFAQTSLIAARSAWKYLDNGSNQAPAWLAAGFSDASWATGNAQLGYGDGDEATVVKFGPNSAAKYITTYFRKTISIANASLYSGYTLNVKRDDGVVVYVNGIERFRNNMPAGSITYTTPAATSCSDGGNIWQTATLSGSSFITGSNVLQVEIHQNQGSSSDISFDLELKATTTLDVTAPVIASYLPAKNATNVANSNNLTLSFNENIQKGTGNIIIKEGGIITQTIAVTSTAVTITGGVVTIDPANFNNSALVNIEIAAGVFKDMSNNNFAGITTATSWNFSTAAAVVLPQVTLISAGTAWKYLDNGSNQGTAWVASGFSDNSWATGNAQLGYGDGDEATVVKFGPNSAAKFITTYFRKTISATNASLYSSYVLNVKRDDGVVVYINGIERFRNNMPAGPITYATLAATGCSDDGKIWQTATLPSGSLINGTNVIQVEIHQNLANSSDISFDLELKATTTTIDVTAPVIASYLPADNSTNVANSNNLTLNFNENVQKGTGNIIIKEGGVITQTIAVTSAAVTITGAVVTIDPANFNNSALVNIEIAAGVFKDMSNNNFEGITNATTWNFSTAAAVTNVTTTLTRGPYLQMGTPNSVVIRWRSADATNSKISYGLSAASLTFNVNDATAETNHEIQISGLTANTKYFYSIGSSTQKLQGDTNNYFITAPVVGTEKKTRIWVTGDCGNKSTNQLNVLNQYQNFLGTGYTDVWMLLGDNAYSSGLDNQYQTNFFDIYNKKMLKQTVLWPAPGNHDYDNNVTNVNTHAVAYYDVFTLPIAAQAGGVASNSEAYYSYNYANIHFISLDSYGRDVNTYKLYDTLGPQAIWVKKDLAANKQKWTIVYWHHPPYTMGSHNSDTESELVRIRQNFIQILERYKVDLILCGHSHGYERSKLLKGYYGNEASFTSAYNLSQSSGAYDGTASSCPYSKNSTTSYNGAVYVVSGSAGQLNTTGQASFPHAAMHYSNITNGGSFVIDVEANRLDAKWLCADGVIRDKFTIVKDVSTLKSISIVKGISTVLKASWIGSYSWTNAATTRSITVTPIQNTTYIVKDAVSCLADTFNVTVTLARPVNTKNTSVTILNNEKLGMKIFPNPATNQTTIEYNIPVADRVSLEIYDLAGKRIKSFINQIKNNGTYHFILNTGTERLRAGMYFIKLTSGKKQVIEKVSILL